MESTNYKIVLVGDGCVGKTTWVKKLLTNQFETKYVSTLGVEAHPIHVNTNRGLIVFNIWDCAGVAKFAGLREGYYINADGAIVMYDSTNQATHLNVVNYGTKLNRANNSELPIVYVATKCDNGSNIPDCINISTKFDRNTLTPLLELVRTIRNDPDLEFQQ